MKIKEGGNILKSIDIYEKKSKGICKATRNFFNSLLHFMSPVHEQETFAMETKYIFREIIEKDELEKFFRMRYDVYSNCRLQSFLKPNKHSIDMDLFDIHSRHFSLKSETGDAGYLRIVLPKEELTQAGVIEIGEKYNIIKDYNDYLTSQTAPFPFLDYSGVPCAWWNYYKRSIDHKQNLAEASRLILQPELRTISLSRFLIECALVLYFIICLGRKRAILTCYKGHRDFYESYGFKPIGNEEGYSVNGINMVATSLSSMPLNLDSRFGSMLNQFTNTGIIEKAF